MWGVFNLKKTERKLCVGMQTMLIFLEFQVLLFYFDLKHFCLHWLAHVLLQSP